MLDAHQCGHTGLGAPRADVQDVFGGLPVREAFTASGLGGGLDLEAEVLGLIAIEVEVAGERGDESEGIVDNVRVEGI